MADPIIQSNGRIGVLQQFMFENETLLDKIPGIDIERTKIGSKTGEVDDILGKGTATALESILLAAGIPEGGDYNADAQSKLHTFLIERGMDSDIVIKFVNDVGAVLNDKDLGPIYQRNAKADEAAISKALEAEQKAQEPKPAEKDPEPKIKTNEDTPPEVEVTGPVEFAGRTEMHREAPITVAQVETVQKNIGATTPEFFKNYLEQGVAISTMALNPNTLVNQEGKIIEQRPVYEEYKVEGAEIKTAEIKPDPKITETAASSDVISESFPPFKGVGVPVLKADFIAAQENQNIVSRELAKSDDMVFKFGDLYEMRHKDHSPETQNAIALVEAKHQELLDNNPDLIAINEQKTILEAQNAEINAARQECLSRLSENFQYLNRAKDLYGDATFTGSFQAVVDGKLQTFENFSLNRAINGKVPGVGWGEWMDRKNVVDACKEQFHKEMMQTPEYAQIYAQYNEDAAKLVGSENTNGMPTSNFEQHYAMLDIMDNMKHGDFNVGANMKELYALENRAFKIERGIEQQATYVVSRTELDTFAHKKEMIAQKEGVDQDDLAQKDPVLNAPPV